MDADRNAVRGTEALDLSRFDADASASESRAFKLALLKGNRFNPWHVKYFGQLRVGDVTTFSAD